MTDERMIDSVQKKLVHIAVSKIGISDSEYRELLLTRYFAASCTELTYKEASDLIDHFKLQGFKIVTKKYERKKTAPNIIHLVSKEQLAKIDHLKADVRWHVHDGFNRWLKKYLKKDHVTTGKEANNVIEALKGMKERQQDNSPRSPLNLRGDGGVTEGVHLCRDGGMHGGYYRW